MRLRETYTSYRVLVWLICFVIGWSLGVLLNTAEGAEFEAKVKTERIIGNVVSTETVEKAIKKLQPRFEKSKQLAKLLVQYSPDPIVSVAILMQESGFRDIHVTEAGFDPVSLQYTLVYKDLGIAQINAGTVMAYSCDRLKLLAHSLDEAIKCHSRVLRDKMKLCMNLGKEAPSCYNSTFEKPRREYWKHINRWLRIISP